MKQASILLSIILMILSCMPCADSNSGMDHTETSQSGHSEEKHNDLCSPFCICNCCGIQVLSFTPALSFTTVEVPAVFIIKPEIGYTSRFASMFSGSIWQPPQIV